MADQIADILARIHDLQERLEEEFEKRRTVYNEHLKSALTDIRHDVLVRHRALRMNLFAFFRSSNVRTILVSPVIYSLIVPLALLDLWVTLYQHICFRAYGIPRVGRRSFIVMDREKLAYLNAIEKLNCLYCGYGNGVIAYTREIASRTEQYWCPIKHANRVRDPHKRYLRFLDYGDAEGYRARLEELRDNVKSE